MNRFIVAITASLLGVSTAYGKVTYLHSNPQGSIVAATDELGNQLWVKRYTPYGIESEAVGTVSDAGANHGYATHEVDKETGLVYMKARFYDPLVGRFLSRDPIGAGSNFYAYSNNGPLSAFDPDGLDAVVSGWDILIRPFETSVPSISIPNIGTLGAVGISSSGFFSQLSFHHYSVITPTMLDSSYMSTIGSAIATNPTPGMDSPASIFGTVNDAGPLPFIGKTNLVMSFLVASPDPSRYTDITVNYTIAGYHGLSEGFVMRYGEIGSDGSISMRSYGEGNAWMQGNITKSYWGGEVEKAWQYNQSFEIMTSLDKSNNDINLGEW